MVEIKICGLTRREDLALAGELGADYAGFVFVPSSPRSLRPQDAAVLAASVRTPGTARVGVFVNEKPEKVRDIFRLCRLDAVQLHGDESPGYCRSLKLPYWKALRPKSIRDLERMGDYPEAVILLDAFVPGIRGGTGRPIEPGILATALKSGRRIIVAGGVSPEGLEFILALRPGGLDVNSAIEDRPGIKNGERMRLFFERKKEIEEKIKSEARP